MSLSRVNRKCVHALYKNCVKEFIISFLFVQKQTDGYNCGHFAIVFAAKSLDGKKLVEVRFNVEKWQLDHLFRKQISHIISKNLTLLKSIL